MAEVSVASRLQESGAHALELDNVARHFGALVALTGISMRIAASERRAVIGSNGAGKTTLFNAITGDFLPTSGRIRFFNEDSSVGSASAIPSISPAAVFRAAASPCRGRAPTTAP